MRRLVLLLLAAPLCAGPDVDALVREFGTKRTDDERRLEIIRELGAMRHSDASRALFDLVRKRRTRRPLECVLELCPAADPQTVRDLIQMAKLDRTTALPEVLGLALPTVIDAEAGPWVIEKGLVARNPAVRLACIRALAAWGTPEARAPLLKLAKEQLKRGPARREADLLYECVRALRAIGGSGVDDLVQRCAADRDWRARLAAAGDGLLYDDVAPVRWASIRAATLAAGADLVVLLRRGGPRSRALARAALARVAGADHGDSADRWEQWARQLGQRPDPRGATLAPVPERVLFLVDTSEPMAGPPGVAPTRQQAALREVREILDKLDESALVNVLVAGAMARDWDQRAYLPATEANRRQASFWLERQVPVGMGPSLKFAFKTAFDHPQPPHTVHLICGWPPQVTEPAELRAILHRENRLHGAVFHTVSIRHGESAGVRRLEEMLRQIAQQTGGEFRSLAQPVVKLR